MPRRILIADPSPDFQRSLAKALPAGFQVCCCSTGDQALELVHSFRPHILVTELTLANLDGFALLNQLSLEPDMPMVVVTPRLVNPYILETMQKLGVAYAMLKPCSVRILAQRIVELELYLPRVAGDDRALVTRLLLALSVPDKLDGFRYLVEAVCLQARQTDIAITKELYPAVGDLCGTDPKLVERSIRTAIQKSWAHRDDPIWRLYFPPDPAGFIAHPTNAAFISRLAEALRLQLPQLP